ncbi:MAG: hypothetical protein HQL84_09405 [Magnetococcales bacterium]|nr:hypothetical protein [Magnetococcales bacterium]MBF0150248.1 hypothetical protein [Magnetococcales bacterium]MBF0172778.1 hypothetical protein [Magnetococcales bacterium]MBF0347754.1 hypothetical protein [Magnetococcales bacterium]MBF0630031.1 hypothetical protein [Magnetococcales bacterium]
MRILKSLTFAAIVMVGSFSFATISMANDGEKTYYRFLCDHCHGKDGKAPKADTIPSIGGKSAELIRKEAGNILSGERKGRATVMHAKYYSAQATSEACDTGPNAAELESIANWLAQR